jgi:hypothetical protein
MTRFRRIRPCGPNSTECSSEKWSNRKVAKWPSCSRITGGRTGVLRSGDRAPAGAHAVSRRPQRVRIPRRADAPSGTATTGRLLGFGEGELLRGFVALFRSDTVMAAIADSFGVLVAANRRGGGVTVAAMTAAATAAAPSVPYKRQDANGRQCFRCRKVGHIASECRTNWRDRARVGGGGERDDKSESD